MAGVIDTVGVSPRSALSANQILAIMADAYPSAFSGIVLIASNKTCMDILAIPLASRIGYAPNGMGMVGKGIPIQRRALNADSGPCCPGPDIEGSVPYADSGPGVSGSPAGRGGSEADSRLGISGGDAGGSRCRAAVCVPSHSAQPVGMSAAVPDHMMMPRLGIRKRRTSSSARMSMGLAIRSPPQGYRSPWGSRRASG